MTDPWTLAHDRARAAGVTLAPLTTVEDADRINDVIDRTWGGQHLDREVVRALAISGNVSWGAFDGDRLVGFVLGWAGVDDAGLHVHSHMLASIPDRRHRGVGESLKLAQRAQALEQGIDLVRWTFDPLVARNAWLNLGKLGAVIDGFARASTERCRTRSTQGERSDRAFIAWDLRREPGPRPSPVAPPRLVRDARGEPAADDVPIVSPVSIEIPREYHDLRAADPARADRWRDAIADAFERCLSAGLVGAGLRSRSVRLRLRQRRPRVPRESDRGDRAVPDRAPARAAVPGVVRHLDREAVRARARADRRRRGLGRMRRRRRLPRVLGRVERGSVDPAARRARYRRSWLPTTSPSTRSRTSSASSVATRWRRPR